jgi:hypothetical protein
MKPFLTTRPIRLLRLPAAALAILLLPAAGAIEEGDSRDTVIESLGKPLGGLTAGGLEVLQYKLGTVELQDGVVVSSDLISQEVFDLRKAAREERIAQEKKRADEARERRIADGTAELKRIEEDKSFAAKPASDRLKYWQDFHRKYPEVNVSAQLSAAQSEVRGEEVRMAALKEEFRQGMREPPIRASSRKLRKYRRGRSPGAIQKREDQLMAELFPEESGD